MTSIIETILMKTIFNPAPLASKLQSLHHNLFTRCVFTVSVAGPGHCPLEDLFALHVC